MRRLNGNAATADMFTKGKRLWKIVLPVTILKLTLSLRKIITKS